MHRCVSLNNERYQGLKNEERERGEGLGIERERTAFMMIHSFNHKLLL